VSGTLVDSNVLLDVFTEDPRWFAWSAAAMERCADEGILLINTVIYAEISIGFERIEDLEAALPASLVQRQQLTGEMAFLAGKAFLAYRRKGGGRRSPLPDFFIGAHAAVAGLRLLTRDSRRYKTNFPGLEVIAPPLRA
jgi:hypothetical protein